MIVIGSTTVAWKIDSTETRWLTHAEELAASAEVEFFLALEVDARGLEPFEPLLARFAELNGTVWTFGLNDGVTELDTTNRLRRICMGRNLVIEYAMERRASHVLFLDTDLLVPGDALTKLLEMDHPVAGGEVPIYGLHGPVVDKYDYEVQEHWNTASFLLVQRKVFRQVRWRYDPEAGMSDDPCYGRDALMLGFPTYVRKDLIGEHLPAWPVEMRSDVDRRVYR